VKEVILTPQGYKKLQEEIQELSTVRRREVAERIDHPLHHLRRHEGAGGIVHQHQVDVLTQRSDPA